MLMMSLVSVASELDLQLTPEHRQQTFRWVTGYYEAVERTEHIQDLVMTRS